MTLTRIKQIPLREKWPNEASDFTPWLAKEGLVLLNETLGMDLILENTEVIVGNYRADIVAKDSLSNDYIVIENQFASTDHDHIGKLFTYAASFQATTLVWIAEKFRPEHRQAIDWFNENSINNIDFFGIEIELLQIEDSPYAPNFKIVSKPNEWTREIRADKQKLTTGSLKQLEFWSAFNDFLNENRVPINLRKAQGQNWYDVAIGNSFAHIALTVQMKKQGLGCEIYMPEDNAKDIFNYLQNEKADIEKTIGIKLEWMLLPDRKASRIISRKDLDPNEESNWNKCFNWYVSSIELFKDAFSDKIKKSIAEMI